MSPPAKALPSAMALGLLGLNLFTAAWWPVPWTDEALFLDPAANWFFGGRFTSSLWHTQPYGEFWISNSPAYSLILAGWLKLFGFSLLASRSLNMVLQALLVWLCLSWANFRLQLRSSQSVLLALLLTLPNSCAFMARSGRYDMLACLLAVSLVLCLAEQKLVWVSVLVAGFLMPWINLPAMAFTVAAVWWLGPPNRRWSTVIVHLGASAGGFLSLLMFSKMQLGGWGFLKILTSLWLGSAEGTAGRASLFLQNMSGFAVDRFWMIWAPLLAIFFLCSLEGKTRPKRLDAALQKWALAGCGASLISLLAYKLNILNCWMFTVPLGFILSAWWGNLLPKTLLLRVGLLGSLLVLGLPLRLAIGFGQQPQALQNREIIQKTLHRGLEREQVVTVYSQWPFYYDLKNKTNVVIGPRFLGTGMSSELVPARLVVDHESPLPGGFCNAGMRPLAEAKQEEWPIFYFPTSIWNNLASGPINRVPVVKIWGN